MWAFETENTALKKKGMLERSLTFSPVINVHVAKQHVHVKHTGILRLAQAKTKYGIISPLRTHKNGGQWQHI